MELAVDMRGRIFIGSWGECGGQAQLLQRIDECHRTTGQWIGAIRIRRTLHSKPYKLRKREAEGPVGRALEC